MGNRDESLDHGSVFKNAPAKSRQRNNYFFGDHSESVQTAGKHKRSISKSKQTATGIKKDACGHCSGQRGTESHLNTTVDGSTRYSTHEYSKHCSDGNYNRRKPLHTQRVASTSKQKQSPMSKMSSECSMNTEDDNGEDKRHEVTVTR
jgi:hypothetical protein